MMEMSLENVWFSYLKNRTNLGDFTTLQNTFFFTTDTPREGSFRDSSLHTHSSLHQIRTTHNTQLTC
jgi:hypothetical protein